MFDPVEPQPNFAAQEEEVLAFWQNENIFEQSVEKNRETGTTYVIYDGPPYANAKPPLHTMVPMTFKDLVGRYRTMKGDYVPRQAGWDTHGLPIEVQVEKMLGLANKKDILNLVPGDESASIKKFNEICRTSVMAFREDWDRFVPRVGYWTDTRNAYVTYEPQYISKAWGVFKELWDKDLLYKGYKVLPYCPRCGTGLSAAEVASEYHDVKDTSVYVSFPLLTLPSRSFLAWTTTPWTLPGNVALAVGPAIDYVVVKQEAGEFILAKSRLEVLKGDYEILEEIKGSDLVGLEYKPIFPGIFDGTEGKKHVVLGADFVTTEDGTGIVHTAVMYGEEDFNLGKREGLAMQHTVDLGGSFLPLVTEFAGQNVRDALVPILKSLSEKGRLYAKQVISHSYPFCWRCKTALIYYAKESWFISMSSLRKDLVAANNKVQWIPEHLQQGRFGEFIKEARDWAVSRERFWGIPFPVWVADSGKQLCIGSLEELRQYAKDPAEIGAEFDPHRPMVDEIVLVKDGEEYHREPFVLDIWFDSGSMPYASGREDKGQFPADYIAEATDMTRGWFYVLHALGTALRGQAPYKRVVCMGLLLDAEGKKMSKSVGNILNPWETFQICGVDAIRWYLYTVNSPGEAKNFGTKELQASFRRTLLLLWNVFNYFVTYANLQDFQPAARTAEIADKTILDEWVLSQQAAAVAKVGEYLEAYDFMRAARTLDEYINDISTWYLRRSRKRTDRAFFQTMYNLLLNLSIMLAPFTPFIAEKIFRTLRTQDMPISVHLEDWQETVGGTNQELDKQMAVVRQSVELGLSLRAAEGLKVRQPLAAAYVGSDQELSDELLVILADELNVLAVLRQQPEEGMPSRQDGAVQVGLDTRMTDELLQAGLARDLLRQIQQLRKQSGLNPGESVTAIIEPNHRFLVEPLLAAYPFVLEDSFVSGVVYEPVTAETEISLNGQTVALALRA